MYPIRPNQPDTGDCALAWNAKCKFQRDFGRIRDRDAKPGLGKIPHDAFDGRLAVLKRDLPFQTGRNPFVRPRSALLCFMVGIPP